jgi:tetratricopeptide (TPR) repeat protein
MLTTLSAVLLLFVPVLPQDQLVLVSGKILSVKKVTEETYKEVKFSLDTGSEGRKSADKVLEVRHNLSSALLNDYVAGLQAMDKGDFAPAVGLFEDALSEKRVVGKSRYAWVIQHALFNQARCMFALADFASVSKKVDQLLQQVPETFFYAPAIMLKAEAARLNENITSAKEAYGVLNSAVLDLGLPERWAREAELALLLMDTSVQGKDREIKLAGLAEKNADKYPTVASRANVEIGHAMVEAEQLDKAERFFQRIAESGAADNLVLASAYSGLGDCWFRRGLNNEDLEAAKEQYRKATLNHLRVIVMHKDAVSLVPRSHYYASMALHRMNETLARTQSRQLASRLVRNYANSGWTKRLKQDLNLR